MDNTDDKPTKLEATKTGAADSGETSTPGSKAGEGDNENQGSGSDDTGGSTTSSSSASGHNEADGQTGDTGLDEQAVYEGVTAEDFQAYSEVVTVHLDALTASSVVIVVALFINAGILAVGTLIRSFERG